MVLVIKLVINGETTSHVCYVSVATSLIQKPGYASDIYILKILSMKMIHILLITVDGNFQVDNR